MDQKNRKRRSTIVILLANLLVVLLQFLVYWSWTAPEQNRPLGAIAPEWLGPLLEGVAVQFGINVVASAIISTTTNTRYGDDFALSALFLLALPLIGFGMCAMMGAVIG